MNESSDWFRSVETTRKIVVAPTGFLQGNQQANKQTAEQARDCILGRKNPHPIWLALSTKSSSSSQNNYERLYDLQNLIVPLQALAWSLLVAY